MELDDLKRFNDGQRTVERIGKLNRQLEVFDSCRPKVKIFGHFHDKRVDFDIPDEDHKFYHEAGKFLAAYREYLLNQIKEQEDYFKSL